MKESTGGRATSQQGQGFQVDGGETYDGPRWASLRNRTDDMLEALFLLQERE